MIVVRETAPGTFERITGNPTLTSGDGKRKAPLRTILHPSWSAKERAAFGIHVVTPAAVPEGKRAVAAPRYARQGGKVVELIDVEDAPPELPPPTPADKVAAMLSHFGLTLDELRTVLAGKGAR